MGTRGAYGFRLNGKDKITYNHFDSYPDCLGNTMIDFIAETTDNELRVIAKRLVLVNEDDCPGRDNIAYYSMQGTLNLGVSSQRATDWYCLLREAQGEPHFWKSGVNHMIDSHNFVYDSLFCEWAYIINLDEDTLEVYKGFNKRPGGKGRYALPEDGPEWIGENGYFGVTLLDEIPLDDIRDAKAAGVDLAAQWDKEDD